MVVIISVSIDDVSSKPPFMEKGLNCPSGMMRQKLELDKLCSLFAGFYGR